MSPSSSMLPNVLTSMPSLAKPMRPHRSHLLCFLSSCLLLQPFFTFVVHAAQRAAQPQRPLLGGGTSTTSSVGEKSTTRTRDHARGELNQQEDNSDSDSWQVVNRYWVFAGGGVRAAAYAGSFARLVGEDAWDQPLSSRVNGAMGASAGAITAMLVTLGFSPRELLQYLISIDWESFADGPTESDFVNKPIATLSWIQRNLWNKFGWNTGDPLRKALGVALSMRKLPETYTFKQLLDEKKQELFVVAFSVSQSASFIFSAETTPNVPIRDAVLTSSSMPFYFTARFWQKVPVGYPTALLTTPATQQGQSHNQEHHNPQEQLHIKPWSKNVTLSSAHQTSSSSSSIRTKNSEAVDQDREMRYVENVLPYGKLTPPKDLLPFGAWVDPRSRQTIYAPEPFADGGTMDNYPMQWLLQRKKLSEGNIVLGFLVLDSEDQVNWFFHPDDKTAKKSSGDGGKAFEHHINPGWWGAYPSAYLGALLTVQQYKDYAGVPEYTSRTVAIDTLGVSSHEWDVLKNKDMVRKLVIKGCEAFDNHVTPPSSSTSSSSRSAKTSQQKSCDDFVADFLGPLAFENRIRLEEDINYDEVQGGDQAGLQDNIIGEGVPSTTAQQQVPTVLVPQFLSATTSKTSKAPAVVEQSRGANLNDLSWDYSTLWETSIIDPN
ncbi:unnamed protein product [Amoebophrya sp. A25]|nr:unnamed protein product [Amoebophrya sp. A25]|eukprot:GSA25T00021825001.1